MPAPNAAASAASWALIDRSLEHRRIASDGWEDPLTMALMALNGDQLMCACLALREDCRSDPLAGFCQRIGQELPSPQLTLTQLNARVAGNGKARLDA